MGVLALSCVDRAVDAEDGLERALLLLGRYCGKCHGPEKQNADIHLLKYDNVEAVARDRKIWRRVRAALSTREMPPRREPQLNDVDRDFLIDWVEAAFSAVDCDGPRDPGRVTLRRLNRTEYDNTVEALFGVDLALARSFPADDTGYGFDNIGDVLSLSPVLLEKYLDAAEEIAAQVIVLPSEGGPDRELPAAHQRLLTCTPEGDAWADCARTLLRPIVTTAFRRPVREPELDRLVVLVELARENGESFEQGIRVGLQAILVSPYFLFHVVEERPGEEAGKAYPLSEFELASRLAYFLWSRPPDEDLFRLAASGRLRAEGVLEREVRRLLKDSRADALGQNFASQWLQLRQLQSVSPDPETYPDFDAELGQAMRKETELFFAAIVREDRSVLELLDADFSYVNARLAAHYDLDGELGATGNNSAEPGDGFRRVQLTEGRRGGLLTHASILTLTSNPTRTSPVKRGKWILEQLLGAPPPPPPPDVPELEDREIEATSLRERLEKHRVNPACASCHKRMDPLGFALEHYDAIGAWRDRDGLFPIDASGTLPDGTFFDGAGELSEILAEKRREDFVRALTEKLMTYGLGRGLEYHDVCTVDRIVEAMESAEYRFSNLVLEIVRSAPFQMRRSRGSGS